MSPPRGESVLTVVSMGKVLRHGCLRSTLGVGGKSVSYGTGVCGQPQVLPAPHPALNDLLLSVHIPGQPLAIFLSPLPVSTQEHGL